MHYIKKRQLNIIEIFKLFDNWNDKYLQLIEFSKNLKSFSDKMKSKQNLIEDCQSQVWLYHCIKLKKIFFYGISDSHIVSGIIYILIYVYSNSYPQDIKQSDAKFIDTIGLNNHLSILRINGMHSLIKYIYTSAEKNIL